jgi:hypothetical protein
MRQNAQDTKLSQGCQRLSDREARGFAIKLAQTDPPADIIVAQSVVSAFIEMGVHGSCFV